MSNSGGENFRHLSIFLSYGHDECDFRDMICEAIRARGHKVWFDAEQINFNDSWRQKIEKGILTSDAVIGCLSKYSTRARSVCLDELSIAAGVRGGRNVYTLLLDKEDEVQPPSSVADRQWLDMSEWKTKRAQGDAVFKPWFAAKMQELFNTIESPENTEFSGQITTIKQNLTVCYGTGKRRKLLQNPFVGREWLTKKIAAWLDDETAPRTCFLYGAPGVGKSAFAAHYAHFNNRVAAALFLDSDMDFFNDPRTIIQTLAFLLACRLPEYRQMLMEYLTDNGREIPMMSEHELFSCLITEPFIHVIDGDHQSMVVVIDGLDETGDESNALANVLFRYTSQLPKWLRILVCGRDVPALHPLTETAAKIELPSGSPENISDIREFFRFRLEETFGSDPLWKNALNSMTARSEGIALYAQLLCDMLLDKKTLICDDFPKGLNGMFTMWFEHYIPDMVEFRNFFRPAICSILGAPGQTLPIPALRHVMEWCRAETNDFLLRLHVLLRRKADRFGEETVTFDHAFVRQWLGSETAGKYYCPPEDGSELLAEKIYAEFERDAAKLTMWEAETLAEFRKMLSKEQKGKIEDSYGMENILLEAAKKDFEISIMAREIAESRYNRDETGEKLLHLEKCLRAEKMYATVAMPFGSARYAKLENTVKKKCAVYNELYTRFHCMPADGYLHWVSDYYALGVILNEQGKIERANEIFDKLCKKLEKRQEMTAEDKYTNTLLCTYQYLTERAKKENDYESVLKICKKACGIAIKAEIAGYIMDFYEYEADAFYNMGKIEEALDTFYDGFLNLKNLCENSEKQQGDDEVRTTFEPISGTAAIVRKMTREALCYYCESVASYCESKIKNNSTSQKIRLTEFTMLELLWNEKRDVDTWNNIAHCCKEIEAFFDRNGETEIAAEYRRKEEKIIEELKRYYTNADLLDEIENLRDIAEMLTYASDMFTDFSNPHKAKDTYEKALALAEVIESKENISYLRSKITSLEESAV